MKKTLRDKYINRPCMTLSQDFANIASGQTQSPATQVLPNKIFLSQENGTKEYCDAYQRNMGAFCRHYVASVPFIFEEQVRVGIAILRMAELIPSKKHLTYYETDSQDGSNARALAELANGKIITLTNGLHKANEESFYNLCTHAFSNYYSGYFCDVTPKLLNSYPNTEGLSIFTKGFDIVYENLTFQFYDKNRIEQIEHIRQLMKDDGILICLEKLLQPNITEYKNREEIKDKKYKSIYFSNDEILWKQSKILINMKFQVNYETLISSLKIHFKYIYLLWNSTNFYEIVASNNKIKIHTFLSFLPKPFIPKEFNFEGDLMKPRKI